MAGCRIRVGEVEGMVKVSSGENPHPGGSVRGKVSTPHLPGLIGPDSKTSNPVLAVVPAMRRDGLPQIKSPTPSLRSTQVVLGKFHALCTQSHGSPVGTFWTGMNLLWNPGSRRGASAEHFRGDTRDRS